MQSETYLTLNIVEDIAGDDTTHGYKKGRVDIIKCKDWVGKINPERLSIDYETAPKYGKLVGDKAGWYVREDKFKE